MSSQSPPVDAECASRPAPKAAKAKSTPTFERINGELVELTKAGTISRMRSHRGNQPALPQNHFCHVCPAKFTRVTHLHRHLRTHTNERVHKCDRCGTEFTRSDLLTRHKRSCGDPAAASRTRRKSCQACADGKTKCDLQQPCSRCKMRGCECTYVRTGRSMSNATQSASPSDAITPNHEKSSSPEVERAVAGPSRHAQVTPPAAPPVYTVPTVPEPPYADPFATSSSAPNVLESASIPIPAYGSVVDNLHNFGASPTWQDFSDYRDYQSSYASSSYAASTAYSDSIGPGYPPSSTGVNGGFSQETRQAVNQHLNALFSQELFDKFFTAPLNDHSAYPTASTSAVPVSEPPDAYGANLNQFPFATDQGVEAQPFMASILPPDLDSMDFYDRLFEVPDMSTIPLAAPRPVMHAVPHPSVEPAVIPYPSEFQNYMHLFYNMFLGQMPIMHVATFTVEGKPPVLLSAMQACGALYVKTRGAMEFINGTLASARDQLVSEFSRSPATPEGQVHFILAVVLLQTIGLFHQRPEQRKHSNFYHGMLVMMIRQSGLIPTLTQWVPPVIDANTNADAVWRSWAFHETTKRAILLSYLHDCCHTIFFTLKPTFAQDEVTIPLPCEHGLWVANTSQEWMAILRKKSPYGETPQRFRPPGVQDALSFLQTVSPNEDAEPALIVTPFAHFILAHAILRKFFEDCIESGAPAVVSDGDLQGEAFTIQYMLHKWLKSWLHSPESPHPTDAQEPQFLFDAMPFYWIAQVSLLAYQEDLPPFSASRRTTRPNGLGEAKFRLIKEWLRHIREFLRKGEDGPTLFWDELIKLRLAAEKAEKEGAAGGSEGGSARTSHESNGGLLGFFASET